MGTKPQSSSGKGLSTVEPCDNDPPPSYAEATQLANRFNAQDAYDHYGQERTAVGTNQYSHDAEVKVAHVGFSAEERESIDFRFELSKSTFRPWTMKIIPKMTLDDLTVLGISLDGLLEMPDYDLAMYDSASWDSSPRYRGLVAQLAFTRPFRFGRARHFVASIRFPPGQWESRARCYNDRPSASCARLPLSVMRLPTLEYELVSWHLPQSEGLTRRADWPTEVSGSSRTHCASHDPADLERLVSKLSPEKESEPRTKCLHLIQLRTKALLATFDRELHAKNDNHIGTLKIIRNTELPSQQLVQDIVKAAATMVGIQERRCCPSRYHPDTIMSRATQSLKCDIPVVEG